ncbi:MAG TPA: endonuclease/exonuclease/phosphatase family protein [Gemmatimonadales bacterium]|nr:endonuclease/exonuclease/phosphatase family protein [Gemmatimonadales bacterium]
MIRRTSALLGACAAALLAGCASTTNLLDADAPRFSGHYALPAPDSGAAPIRIVTFNIKLSRRIDRAIEVLRSDSLRHADLLALEEMDEVGVDRIARALALDYIYYPSSIHPTDHKYFGPAILSRWPIERTWKLLLPHEGRIRHQRRTATAAEVRVRGQRIRMYAVHLETAFRVSDAARNDQVRTILADASGFGGPVVIAGDFNSYGVGPLLIREGYRWLTARLDPTIAFFSWDHIFVRGLDAAPSVSAGLVREVRGASDHRPVWAVVVAAPPRPDAGADTMDPR